MCMTNYIWIRNLSRLILHPLSNVYRTLTIHTKVPSQTNPPRTALMTSETGLPASIEYKTNEEQRGVDEYWQTPEETLSLRSGDCEDCAILLCTLPEPTVSVRSACGTLLVLMMDVLTCHPGGELVSGRRMTGDWLPGSYSSVSWSSQVQPRRC
jgi:hypothetical protein